MTHVLAKLGKVRGLVMLALVLFVSTFASAQTTPAAPWTGNELAGVVTIIGTFLAIAATVVVLYILFGNGKTAGKMVRK